MWVDGVSVLWVCSVFPIATYIHYVGPSHSFNHIQKLVVIQTTLIVPLPPIFDRFQLQFSFTSSRVNRFSMSENLERCCWLLEIYQRHVLMWSDFPNVRLACILLFNSIWNYMTTLKQRWVNHIPQDFKRNVQTLSMWLGL